MSRSEREAAAGYVNAALTSLTIALRRLPDGHSTMQKMDHLIKQLIQLHEELGPDELPTDGGRSNSEPPAADPG